MRKKTNKEYWLIYFEDNTSIDKISISLQNVSLDLDDDIFVALNEMNLIDLWEIYRISPSSSILYNKIATWKKSQNNENTEKIQFNASKKWYRRRDLKGHHFKTTSLVEKPFINSLKLNSFSGKHEGEGSFFALMELLAKTMNFTYDINLPTDNSWGSLQEDGSFNGMINLLQTEIVDIGISFLKS